jgi:hypothetical protein
VLFLVRQLPGITEVRDLISVSGEKIDSPEGALGDKIDLFENEKDQSKVL